jgi:hypothetical protein
LIPLNSRAATDWSRIRSPNYRDVGNYLYGVSGTGPTDVWAVGEEGGDFAPALVEHWDGSAWSIASAPSLPNQTITLYSVAAISTSDAWAVGNTYSYPVGYTTVIDHWDGTAWTSVPVPAVSGYPTSVSAVGSDDVWAVGNQYDVNTGRFFALFEHWDGHSWSVVDGPTRGTASVVSADSATDIWAIGQIEDTQEQARPIIYHYDGTAWTAKFVAPVVVNYDYGDFGIIALSPSDVWAFAMLGSYPNPLTPVFLHYNGSAWSRVRDAGLSTIGGTPFPFGMAFSGPNDGWFIGDITTDGHHILAEHWDGSTWRADSIPNWGTIDAVAAIPGGGYWAVGTYVNPYHGAQTLTLQHP